MTESANPRLIEQLRAVVGPAGLVTQPQAQAAYTRDWLGKWQGQVPVVVRPANTAETAAVVRVCRAEHTPIVTQGGNTGMSGGATPDGSGAQVIVATTRMNRIRAVDSVNNTLTVDAGVVLAHAQQAAREAGRFFPLSLGAEGSCTVGGNLATNAGGIGVLRYGNMRDLVLGLEVVLPDGRIWNGLRGLRKDNTGYDLRGLFVGSEGTLGIITGAVLKLFARPTARATAWVGANDLGALVNLLAGLRARCGERLVAFEMMSAAALALVLAHVADTRAPVAGASAFHALIEFADTESQGLQQMLEDALVQATEDGLVGEGAVVAASQAHAASFWKLREGISQAQVRAGPVVKHDIALPISALPAFVRQADSAVHAATAAAGVAAQVINFGHVGDGNLHYNVLLPAGLAPTAVKENTLRLNRVVHDLVAHYEGSISAEHGVGQLRRDELRRYKSPVEMDLMLAIKRALDPNLIMNPGKLL
ncbi:FAD-binding oxidoreductase [Ramlibacter sp.]|uniref:FAD-binding oxidoreductase n=1 Tax=Ramlibacter sp. TaxID=1917967 RepID=UPI00261667C4|nr:FAD-binding oxidoreductase [Ramlibacter sp.]MDB5954826.1 putative FAD/FMN-containing dehydrogenase protein [Ramlibacter sp.]